jgi:hypothetical protein
VRKSGFPITLAVAAAAVVVGFCLASPEVRGRFHDMLFRSRFVVQGKVLAGERFDMDFGPGFTFSLTPTEHGWCISVLERGTSDDLSRLTIPFHFVPNPRQLDGWHFRNLANTGPNDGGVNAPGAVRDFCFWPGAKLVGSPTIQDVESACAFGRGTLEILDHELENLDPGERAVFAWISFRVDLSWPREYHP